MKETLLAAKRYGFRRVVVFNNLFFFDINFDHRLGIIMFMQFLVAIFTTSSGVRFYFSIVG